MRREKTLKLCANHFILPWMELKKNANSEKAWVWKTQVGHVLVARQVESVGSVYFWASWIRIRQSEVGIQSLLSSNKTVSKALIPTVLCLHFDFISLKNDVHVNVPSKRNKQFFVSILKVGDENSRIHQSEAWIRGSGSLPKCRGSATLVSRSLVRFPAEHPVTPGHSG